MLNFYSNTIWRILKPFERPMNKLSDKAKDIGFILGVLFIIFAYFLNGAELIESRYLYRFAICCVLLGVVILCSIRGELRPVKFKKSLMSVWLIFGLLQLISGIINDENYLPEAVLFLIAFPVGFFAFGNMGFEKVSRLLIDACIISFYVFATLSVLFVPITPGHYTGIFANPNVLGEFASLVFCCILIKAFNAEKSGWCVWYILLLYFTSALLFMSNSRTGMLAAILAFVFFLIFSAARGCFKEKKFKKTLIQIIALFIILTLIALAVFLVAVKMGLVDDDILVKIKEIFLVFKSKLKIRDRNLDRFSSGRIGIWQEYAKKINLTGHPDMETVFVKLPHDSKTVAYRTCHNYFLQMTINYGLIAGLLSVFGVLIAAVMAVKYSFKNRDKKYSMFPVVITVAFILTSLVASPCISFNYMLLLYYYFTQAPLLTDGFLIDEKQKMNA